MPRIDSYIKLVVKCPVMFLKLPEHAHGKHRDFKSVGHAVVGKELTTGNKLYEMTTTRNPVLMGNNSS
jgi:hypothetical protein